MIPGIIGVAAILLMLTIVLRLHQTVETSLAHKVSILEEDTDYPSLSIIKPVFGADAYTMKNFQSLAEQDYNAPLELIFSFQQADGPALLIAENVVGPHEYKTIVNPVEERYSGKMSNLFQCVRTARYNHLVFSDSDIHALPDICRQLATLHNQHWDLISCFIRHVGRGNVWGRIYATFWNYEHMAYISPAIIRYRRDATGGTMAMTRATLEQTGGLSAFKDYVAEDVPMGRRAHDLGLRAGLGPIVDSPVDGMILRALLNKFSRLRCLGPR